MSESWSREEVEAAVADYFDMLVKELRHEPFSKTEHRHRLLARLNGRSEGAIEWKHQNISAVLIEVRCPPLRGYKPRFNYQRLLAEVVQSRLEGDGLLRQTFLESADEQSVAPTIADYLVCLEDPPEPVLPRDPTLAREVATRVPRKGVDYLAREARNGRLGTDGEHFVLNYERARLVQLGERSLAEKVEHVAVTQGDGLGFDIRSFHADGSERMIEVKTTRYGKQVPFYVSARELAASRANPGQYALYRVFDFQVNPRLFVLDGAIDASCVLEPMQYSARVGRGPSLYPTSENT